jgi:chromosome segregation ATPase
VLVIGTLLGLGGGLGYAMYGPVPYKSTALLMVPLQADPADNSFGSPNRVRTLAQTFAAQLASPYVYGLVSQALQGTVNLSTRDLTEMANRREIDIRPQRSANLIGISVTDPIKEHARLIANTFASVAVQDVTNRATGDVDTRRKMLEQQIDSTRQQLITSQLRQQEQDLSKQLHDQRSQLLQIQLQYQQEIQRQLGEAQLQLNLQQLQNRASSSPPPALTPAQQQRIQQLVSASSAVHSQRLQIMRDQQQDLQDTMAQKDSDLGAVREQLDALMPASDIADQSRQVEAATQVQTQRQQLLQREQDLLKQYQDKRDQLFQAQAQYQQAVQRQAELERQADAARATPDQQKMTPAQQQQLQQRLQEIADTTASIRASLPAMIEQQKDFDKAIDTINGQLSEVRQRLAQFPADSTPPDALPQRAQELKAAGDQRAQLEQREQTLVQDLQTQRGQLRQLQLQYDQEMERQTDLDQRQADDDRQAQIQAAAAAAARQPAISPALQQRFDQITDASGQARAQWLQIVSQQQKDVEANIADLSGRLDQVRHALADRPTNTDPLLDAAFATAYSGQLQALTQEYARLQLNAQGVSAPIVRYGEASDPVQAGGQRKAVALGTVAGLAAGAGVAGLLELVRRRRRTSLSPVDVAPGSNGPQRRARLEPFTATPLTAAEPLSAGRPADTPATVARANAPASTGSPS